MMVFGDGVGMSLVEVHREHLCPVHMHLFDELVIASRGKCTIRNGEQMSELSGAFLIYTPRRTAHEQVNDTSVEYSRHALLFDRESLLRGVTLPDEPFSRELSDAELARLMRWLEPLWELHGDSDEPEFPSDAESEAERDLLISLLANELSRLAEVVKSGRGRGRRGVVAEVCDYIEKNFTSRIELDELAAKFFISRTKLTREFRARMGMSVGEYVTLIRISHAKRLLMQSSLSLEDIARNSGFSGASYFIKVFECSVGMTPAHFRRNADQLELWG